MRRWRVGTFSMGLTLILTGVILFVGQVVDINYAFEILKWWPVILILLGIEMLIYLHFSKEEEPKIQYDGASIFIVVLLIVVSIGVTAVGKAADVVFKDGKLNLLDVFSNRTTIEKDYTVNVKNQRQLRINNAFGDVEIQAGEDNKITIHAQLHIRGNNTKGIEQAVDSLIEIHDGDIIEIRSKRGENVGNVRLDGVDYIITVPKKLALSIENQYGDIKIQEVLGTAFLKNDFGDIEYSNLEGIAQNLEISTNYGDIQLDIPEEQKGYFKVNTSFGEIKENMGFSIKEQPTSQSLEEQRGDAKVTIRLKTNYGDITIR